MFKKKNSGTVKEHSHELNAFLGEEIEYHGLLNFVGTVRIDGVFHGEIQSEGILILGEKALVHGQISVRSLLSNGKIVGKISATKKVVMQKKSLFEGEMSTPALVVEEGAFLAGDIIMDSSANTAPEKNMQEQAQQDDAQIPNNEEI